jgi:hypothetical protein
MPLAVSRWPQRLSPDRRGEAGRSRGPGRQPRMNKLIFGLAQDDDNLHLPRKEIVHALDQAKR